MCLGSSRQLTTVGCLTADFEELDNIILYDHSNNIQSMNNYIRSDSLHSIFKDFTVVK